jgi:hypothetical protein
MLFLSIKQDGNRDHERGINKVLGLGFPGPGKAIHVGDVLKSQNLKGEGLKISPKNEMLGLRLLAT